MIKQELKKCLDRYFNNWIEHRGGLPTVYYDEDDTSLLYFGEPTDEEIQWKYRENINKIDFTSLEDKFKIIIPSELKEYYSTYWFLNLEGFYKGELVSIDPISDKSDIISELNYSFENEYNDKVQIGRNGKSDLPIFFNIQNRQVVIYDEENDKEIFLENSLSDFFSKIEAHK